MSAPPRAQWRRSRASWSSTGHSAGPRPALLAVGFGRMMAYHVQCGFFCSIVHEESREESHEKLGEELREEEQEE